MKQIMLQLKIPYACKELHQMRTHDNKHKYYHGYNILKLLDTLPNSLSPQLKRSVIVSNKHGIYELPHEFPNDLTLKS